MKIIKMLQGYYPQARITRDIQRLMTSPGKALGLKHTCMQLPDDTFHADHYISGMSQKQHSVSDPFYQRIIMAIRSPKLHTLGNRPIGSSPKDVVWYESTLVTAPEDGISRLAQVLHVAGKKPQIDVVAHPDTSRFTRKYLQELAEWQQLQMAKKYFRP
jgi:hypothetical protein